MLTTKRVMLALGFVLLMLLSTAGIALAGFSDVQGHWAEETINQSVQQGLIKGHPDGTFKPNSPMTRAEFMALLNRGFGFSKTADHGMSDVSPSAWFAADVARARAEGYLGVFTGDTLKPNQPVTRQEVVTILGTVLRLTPDESAADNFSDAHQFAPWAKGYIGAASDMGYVKGYTNNTFGPERNISRAEVCAVLSRTIGGLYNTAGTYGPEAAIETVKGNVTVNKPGITLRNLVIDGNLYLTEGIGEGSVTLEQVTVLGKTIISGGEGGVLLKNSSLGNVVINTPDNSMVYLIAQGTTKIGPVKIQSSVKLEEIDLTGSGFGDVALESPEGAKLQLAGDFDNVVTGAALTEVSVLRGSIKQMENNAGEALFTIDESVSLDTFTVNQPSQETGKCSIETANINSSNVTIEATPKVVNIAPGLTNVSVGTNKSTNSGGGGSGGGGSGGGGGGGTIPSRDTVTSVKPLPDKYVAFGTTIDLIGLPTSVEVTTSSGTTQMDVTWDNGTPQYNGNLAGDYTFKGTLKLTKGVTNPQGIQAALRVIVGQPDQVDVTVEAIEVIPDITVANGTTIEDLRLPTSVEVTTSNGTDQMNVTWDGGDPGYDGSTAGSYTFWGDLALPSGVTNPQGLKASVKVIVLAPVAVTVTAVDPQADISVIAGTAEGSLYRPAKVWATLNNGAREMFGVTWDSSTPAYNGNTVGTYTFSGTLAPQGDIIIPDSLKAQIKVTVYNPSSGYIGNIDPNPNTPLNTSPGTTIFEFDSLADWTESVSTAVYLDQINCVSGSASARLVSVSPVTIDGQGTEYYSVVTSKSLGAELASMENMEFNIYIPEKGKVDYMLVKFYTDEWHGVFYENGIGDWELSPGWNKIRRTKDDFVFKNTVGSTTADSLAMGTMFLRSSPDMSDPRAILQAKIDQLDNFIMSQQESNSSNTTLQDVKSPDVRNESIRSNDVQDSQAVLGLYTLNEDVNVDDVTSEDLLSKNDLIDDIQGEDSLGEDMQIEDVPSENSLSEDVFIDDVPGEDLLIQQVLIDDVQSEATHSWAGITHMEFFVVSKLDVAPTVNIDRISINTAGQAKLLFTFDDAWYDVLENGYDILEEKGFKGTLWANMDEAVGQWYDPRLFMNEEDLQYLYEQGWDVASHTVNHPDAQEDDATMLMEYLENQEWIMEKGWVRGAHHVCYPSGSYSERLLEILRGIGVKSGRTVEYGIQPTPVSNMYKLKCVSIGRDTNIEKYVKFEIDRAIETGSSLFFMLHRVQETPEPNDGAENYGEIAVSIDNLRDIVNYVDNYVQQNKLEVMTISQWYDAYMAN